MSGPAKRVLKFNPWRLYAGTIALCGAMGIGVYALGVRPVADRREAAIQRQADFREQQETITRLTGSAEANGCST